MFIYLTFIHWTSIKTSILELTNENYKVHLSHMKMQDVTQVCFFFILENNNIEGGRKQGKQLETQWVNQIRDEIESVNYQRDKAP